MKNMAYLTGLVSTVSLLSISMAFGAVKPKPLMEAAQELIQTVEQVDPSTQSKKEEWAPIRKALLTAGQEAQSEVGLQLSLTRILDNWNGKAFRILNEADPQHWALDASGKPFPDSGAVYQSRGVKWTVQYISSRGQKYFRRGDEIKTIGFDPILSFAKASKVELELQGSPMTPLQKVTISPSLRPFADYVLAETQSAGTLLTRDKQRICLLKSWLWLNDAVGAHLISKISFASENCAAQLVDLRDSFGQDPSGSIKVSKKIPTVVLINQKTREGAVRLAMRLKKDFNAQIIGENSGNALLPEQQLSLKTMPWTVLSYAGHGASLEVDQAVKDTLLYAEGLDQVYESGLRWIGEQLKN